MVVIPAVHGVHPQLFVQKCFVSNSSNRRAIQPAEETFTLREYLKLVCYITPGSIAERFSQIPRQD
jgi:hypothetical protein